MKTVFEKMIAGEHPCFRIWEDEQSFGFLARESISPGHSLLVPKRAAADFVDLSGPEYAAFFRAAGTLSSAIQRATGCRRVGMLTGGWEIPHFHLHLIPLLELDGMDPRRAQVRPAEEQREIQGRILRELGPG